MKWVDKHIEIDPPKHPLKITGTRFAAIMGLSAWATPFKTWCEITKTYKEPFEDTIYTIAGKTIEPKQAQYMVDSYLMDNLVRPADVFGEEYFKTEHGDFFHDHEVFGGMWDYLLTDDDGVPTTVLEMKTTKRSEDWVNDVPEYYALQAALYAYLLEVDDVIMVCSFLRDPQDYARPDEFSPSVNDTITVPFKVSERYPDMGDRLKSAMDWWNAHVVTGISPDYDEKADADILKELRTHNVNPQSDVEKMLAEADDLKDDIDAANAAIAAKDKRLKELTAQIKEIAMSQFREGDKKVTLSGRHTWTVSRTDGTTLDQDALKADGLYEKYTKPTVTYRVTVK